METKKVMTLANIAIAAPVTGAYGTASDTARLGAVSGRGSATTEISTGTTGNISESSVKTLPLPGSLSSQNSQQKSLTEEESVEKASNPDEGAAKLRQDIAEKLELREAKLAELRESLEKGEGLFDDPQFTTLSLIVEKYSDKDLSSSDWSQLYQELEKQGFDISKPLIDVLI